jgi:hypothetical protein
MFHNDAYDFDWNKVDKAAEEGGRVGGVGRR